jgi:hypothetical protein
MLDGKNAKGTAFERTGTEWFHQQTINFEIIAKISQVIRGKTLKIF